jgi:polar amino acid transport system substrate-binding protein
MQNRGSFKAWALAAALAAGALFTTMPAVSAEPLRVCADPDNLPFSKAEGPVRGLYVELAELVAQQLGRPIEFTWWYTYNQRRALRNTVLDNACDTVFALPADYRARGLVKSHAFIDVGYAVVADPSFKFKSLDDLRPHRIGVQFSSTPHIVLNTLDGFRSTTYRSSDEVFGALAKGEIDMALMWGPVAGYENRTQHASRWRVTPVAGHDFAGQMVVAVRRDREDLLKDIDGALSRIKPQIALLAEKYAFPQDKPVPLARVRTAPLAHVRPVPASVAVPASMWAAVADAPKADPKTEAKPEAKAEAATPEAAITAGRVRFNDQCSHCHGVDGYSPVRERDLRRLKSRYNDKWLDTALLTIRQGRSDAGMPAWKDILKESDVQELVAFLGTVQRQ